MSLLFRSHAAEPNAAKAPRDPRSTRSHDPRGAREAVASSEVHVNTIPTIIFGTRDNDSDQRAGPGHELNAEEMAIPYVYERNEKWLDAFAPDSSTKGSSTMHTAICGPDNDNITVLHRFVEAAQNSLGDGYVIRITSSHQPERHSPDTKPPLDANVDLAVFKADCNHWPAAKEENVNLAQTSWDGMAIPIEIRNPTSACPFPPFQDKCLVADPGRHNRGQVTSDIGKIFSHQHRTFVFSIHIHGELVYLVRWDHAGAIVATPFSLLDESHKVHTFLSRFAKMDPAQQGYDDSIRSALPSEAKMFLEFTTTDPVHQAYLEEARAPRGGVDATISVVQITGCDGRPNLRLAFGRPRFMGREIVGKATRGYIAYDLDNQRLVFLKDCWHPASESCHPELQTYEKLRQANVQFIATPLGGGDVYCSASRNSPQQTITQDYLPQPLGHEYPYSPRKHYRLVLGEVAQPLEDYETPFEMVVALYCAVVAHQQAWENAGVLHRDISGANILITGSGAQCRGILIDWDMCKYKDTEGALSGPTFRSGTWYFMSALLLQNPRKPHQVSDDIESFVHVINWLTFRFHIDWGSRGFTGFPASLQHFAEYFRNEKGVDVGGGAKLDNIRFGKPGFDPSFVTPPALRTLVEWLADMCKEHYSSPDAAKWLSKSSGELNDGEVFSTGLFPKKENSARRAIRVREATGKPLLNNHDDILESLTSAIELRWIPGKFGDHLKSEWVRDHSINFSTFGTRRGGTASHHSTSQLRAVVQGGSNVSGSSSSRTRRRDNTEDIEDESVAKRVRRNHESKRGQSS
ncbi:hypothetical protein NLI96_g10426 [Meripilus lineatus]|uniref:Fungal-type protein kinase domain-containing protein n=1 Tax=Meripilus lineatus TaxID=2056292 RepID=A0AAD5YC10_9APHY|nr:hypothetical protein NLI96_g10426 [Physisporinus lineatus]